MNKDASVMVRIEEKKLGKFDRLAKRHGLTRSDLVRRLMVEFSNGDGDLDTAVSEVVAMVKFKLELSAKRRRSA